MSDTNNANTEHGKLPIAKNEDVEFSMDRADEDDLEAVARMKAADNRAEKA